MKNNLWYTNQDRSRKDQDPHSHSFRISIKLLPNTQTRIQTNPKYQLSQEKPSCLHMGSSFLSFCCSPWLLLWSLALAVKQVWPKWVFFSSFFSSLPPKKKKNPSFLFHRSLYFFLSNLVMIFCGYSVDWMFLFIDVEVNGSFAAVKGVDVPLVPLVEAGKVEKMVLNESRRRLGSFRICALCTCCGGAKGLCLPSPCCYAINCNIPNRPFGFCSFTPKTCNCFGCHI